MVWAHLKKYWGDYVRSLGEIPKKSYCMIEGIFNQKPSIMCVEALTDCSVLSIECMEARRIIFEDEFLMRLWIKVLEESVIYKTERENSFLSKGMTPVSLSRIKHALKEERLYS